MASPAGEKSAGIKVLMGCTIGCVVIILLVIGCGVGIYFWATGRREVVDPGKLIPQATHGFAILRVRPDDKGLQQAFVHTLIAHQQAVGQPVPPKLQQLKQGGPEVQKQLANLLPANLLVVTSWDEKAGKRRVAGVFSFAGYWRLVRFFLNKTLESAQQQQAQGARQIPVQEHAGVKIGQFGGPQAQNPVWVGMYLNNVIVAESPAAAGAVIDRLQAPAEPTLDPALAALYGRVDKDQDVVFAFTNEHDAAQTLLKKVLTAKTEKAEPAEGEKPEEPETEEPLPFDVSKVTGVAGHLDLVSSDVVQMRAVLTTASEEDAASLAAELEEHKAKLMEQNPDLTKMDLKVEGTAITIDAELKGLEKRISDFFKANAQQMQRGAPPFPIPMPGAPMPQPMPAPQPQPAPAP
jgi:hypothetical protein